MIKFELFLTSFMLIVLVTFTSLLISGCFSRSKTTVATTEVRRDIDEGAERRIDSTTAHAHDGIHNDRHFDENSTIEVTKSEEVTTEESPNGIFGILGDIIALPFRALAAIF